jgi:hypothetical protein
VRLDQLVEVVRLRLVPGEVRVADTVVIVDCHRVDVIIVDVGQGDRLWGVLRCLDRILEQIMCVKAAVDADDLHHRADAGFVSGAADDRVGDEAIFVELQTDGVGIAGIAAATGQTDRLGRVRQLPAAVLDAAGRRVG